MHPLVGLSVPAKFLLSQIMGHNPKTTPSGTTLKGGLLSCERFGIQDHETDPFQLLTNPNLASYTSLQCTI